MSDHDDIDLGDEHQGTETSSGKPSGLAALLPNLLKFVAIGLGALIFIVTIAVITYSLMNKSGQSQTVLPDNGAYIGTRPQYSFYTALGPIRTNTKDPLSYAVVVDMVIGYDQNDKLAAGELAARLYELRDFVRSYFRGKMAVELQPENEVRLKQEIIEQLNTRILSTAKVRLITFNQLDVMDM